MLNCFPAWVEDNFEPFWGRIDFISRWPQDSISPSSLRFHLSNGVPKSYKKEQAYTSPISLSRSSASRTRATGQPQPKVSSPPHPPPPLPGAQVSSVRMNPWQRRSPSGTSSSGGRRSCSVHKCYSRVRPTQGTQGSMERSFLRDHVEH